MSVIEARGLTKVFRRPIKAEGLGGSIRHLFTRRYTDHRAVAGIDLSIEAGEAVAYVGPNGAGKSTTVKLLSGILVPTAGEVRVGRRRAAPRPDGQRRATSASSSDSAPSCGGTCRCASRWRCCATCTASARPTYRDQLDHFDEVLGLGELLPVVARKLSLGQRMRADLAAALLHRPRIVYLDEPTIGLDIAVKDRVRALLRQNCARRHHADAHHPRPGRHRGRLPTHRHHRRGPASSTTATIEAVKDSFARQRELHLQFLAPAAAAVRLADLAALSRRRRVAGHDAGEHGRVHRAVRPVRAHRRPGGHRGARTLGEVVDFRLDEPAIEDVVRKVYAGDLLARSRRRSRRRSEACATVPRPGPHVGPGGAGLPAQLRAGPVRADVPALRHAGDLERGAGLGRGRRRVRLGRR